MNVVQFSVEPLLRVAQAFPATPRIMADLGRLLANPTADLKDVTVLLKADGALAARLLRVANSAALGQAEHVASIDDAAALIGFREIHRLVGAVAADQFSQANHPLYGLSGRQLRENALLVGLLMEELAPAIQQDPNAAYTAGLFRSIGKLTLEKLAEQTGSVPAFQTCADGDLVRWEKHAFGITANDAAAIILRQWRFPPEIPQAIAAHFSPGGNDRSLALLLNLSASTVEKLGHGLPGEARYWLDADAVSRQFGIGSQAGNRAIERALSGFERLSRAVG